MALRYDTPPDDPSANVVSLDTIARARLILGADYDPSGKSEMEILRAVAALSIGVAKASQRSPDYLRAMLDVASDLAKGSRA